MANVIAVVWDFDKTLVDGYMQDPIFDHYGIDSDEFWKTVNALPAYYLKTQGVHVNKDTIYLNHFINCAHNGTFPGLNNALLKSFGSKLKFYSGVPEILDKTKSLVAGNSIYQVYDIKVEHYIVSTGMKIVIEGSTIMSYVDGVWGCELIEREVDGAPVISEIGYSIDNTSKTRAIFEINKGVPKHPEIDVNAKISKEMRRVPFENIIYIADGPSDVPAFSLVNQNGGATFAIYPKQDKKAFYQVEQLRMAGRINMYAEADYTEGTTAYMWIINKVTEIADRIVATEKARLTASISSVPQHITSN